MQNIFNKDFQAFIQALNKAKVEYILVGGYSVILHGYIRTTGDMDIWVNPTTTNYKRLVLAFEIFGMSLFDMNLEKFMNTQVYDVFSFGRPPMAIEILTKVKGLSFTSAYKKAQWFDFEDFKVCSLGLSDLKKAKKEAGRYKDLNDLEHL